jgi:hypothetical protein
VGLSDIFTYRKSKRRLLYISEAVMTYDHNREPNVSAPLEFVTTTIFTSSTVWFILMVAL